VGVAIVGIEAVEVAVAITEARLHNLLDRSPAVEFYHSKSARYGSTVLNKDDTHHAIL